MPKTATLCDADIIRRLLSSSPAAARLWNGDANAYRSRSEADWALARELMKLVGPDTSRVASLMWESRLGRSKWEEPRGATTWLTHTVTKAAAPTRQPSQAVTAMGTCGYVTASPNGLGVTLGQVLVRLGINQVPSANADKRRVLTLLCQELQRRAGDGPFWLGQEAVGKALGVRQQTVSDWLRTLERKGLLSRHSTGNRRTKQASEWQFHAHGNSEEDAHG